MTHRPENHQLNFGLVIFKPNEMFDHQMRLTNDSFSLVDLNPHSCLPAQRAGRIPAQRAGQIPAHQAGCLLDGQVKYLLTE
jgi:hypothetical protein